MKKQKIMILVPHEDDEVNLVGGLLHLDSIDKSNCYLVFMTNGDYEFRCETRVKEAKKSAQYLGIPLENVIFLGYPDQAPKEKNHLYHTRENIFCSIHNQKETYCHGALDFHYQIYKKHAAYCYDSLIEDFILLIKTIKPDVIFVNDFDSHPDHRCCSLSFEKALGIYLKEDFSYQPQVLKGFAYPTSYKSMDDFKNINLESTKFNTEPHSYAQMQNPYYRWEDRIRFPIGKSCRNRFIIRNAWYQNIRKHRSQSGLLRAYSKIINSDQVFFQRRTDNLALHAQITTSSGESKYLNDFMLFDCKNILNGNNEKPELLDLSWIPDSHDEEKTIKIEFPKPKDIEEIVFYQNINTKYRIQHIEITFSDHTIEKQTLSKNLVNKFQLKKKEIKWIEIKILDSDIENSGFSEIEIFEAKERKYQFIKILDEDNFIYNYYDQDLNKISIYAYNGIESKYLDFNDCNFYQDNVKIEYGKFNRLKKRKVELKISLKEDPTLKDTVIIKNMNVFAWIKYYGIHLLNEIIFTIHLFSVRVVNKIKKIYRGIV